MKRFFLFIVNLAASIVKNVSTQAEEHPSTKLIHLLQFLYTYYSSFNGLQRVLLEELYKSGNPGVICSLYFYFDELSIYK